MGGGYMHEYIGQIYSIVYIQLGYSIVSKLYLTKAYSKKWREGIIKGKKLERYTTE